MEEINDRTEILEDSHLDFFLQNGTETNIDRHFHVTDGKSFEMVVADFSDQSNSIHVDVDLEEGSRCSIKVASICFKDNNKKVDINVYHNGKRSFSRTTMAGINLANGTLRFLGNSYIKNGASKSDTRQEGKITNLSSDSKSEVSPALLIKENDVKASHGAALGAYNPDVLFYMMSRGISLEESKKLITIGTLFPILESFDSQEKTEDCKKALEVLHL